MTDREWKVSNDAVLETQYAALNTSEEARLCLQSLEACSNEWIWLVKR